MKVLAAIVLTVCAMSILAELQERRAFDNGVRTVLCAQSAAIGESQAGACKNLSEHQRSYAVRVGREIADDER